MGRATPEVTFYDIDLTQAAWLIRPEAAMALATVEGRIIIDSTHLGRYFGIPDLMVEAPPQETNDATGGTTESGISSSQGLVFTGTPKSADFGHRVSVSVDLAIGGPDQTVLGFAATGVLTGAGTADQSVPDGKATAVLAAFTTSLPDQKLPLGITPTRAGARGSDIILDGIAHNRTLTVDGFTQP